MAFNRAIPWNGILLEAVKSWDEAKYSRTEHDRSEGRSMEHIARNVRGNNHTTVFALDALVYWEECIYIMKKHQLATIIGQNSKSKEDMHLRASL